MSSLKPPRNKESSRLNAAFNSAWGLVSLQGKSLQFILDHVGIKNLPSDILHPTVDTSIKPSYELFAKIKKYVMDQQEKSQTITTAFDSSAPSWLESDFLIESLPVKGYKKLSHREQIAELVAPLLPPKNPAQTCQLFYFQEEASNEAFYALFKLNYRAIMFRANTGDGKTFANGEVLRRMLDMMFAERAGCLSPHPYLYVTKASIVHQTTRDLRVHFGIKVPEEVLVLNYDALRSSLGEMFIKEETIIDHGEERRKVSWRKILHPIVIVWDECQSLKNDTTQQTQIAVAFNNLEGPTADKTIQIFSSATPFSKVSSAKAFCLATKIPYSYGLDKDVPLTETRWNDFASSIAYPGNPKEYSKAAIGRLVDKMKPYIIGFKNVRRKFHAINQEEIIDFRKPEDAQKYHKAFEEYLEAKGKLEACRPKAMGILILVELLKFRQAAELIRAEELADRMYAYVQEGFAGVCACNFKPTIAKAVMLLNGKYGVKRDKISLIWGGDAALGSKAEKKWTREEIQETLKRAMVEDIPDRELKEILKQLQYEAAGLGDIPDDMRMGIQNREERWKNIEDFQEGRSLYCFFTFGAGGAGLSLHHEHTYTRPRRTIVSPTWNEMELNQALGRAPRLTSLSDTLQSILLYRGTVEINVLHRVNVKSQCLTKVIEQSEDISVSEKLLNQILEMAGASTSDEEDDDLGHEVFEEKEKEWQEKDE